MPRRNSSINNREKILIAVTFVAIIFSVTMFFLTNQNVNSSQVPTTKNLGIADLSTEGFVAVKPQAEVVNGEGFIRLEGNCYRVDAGSDVEQAQSIKDGLEGTTGPRPNAHELMRDAFSSLGIKVLMVKITELKDKSFFGKIMLQQGNTILSLDAKPSDGIAIAIRTNATVYFNQTLLKERGQNIC